MAKQNLIDLTKSITADELIDFLQSTLKNVGEENENLTCHYCRADSWQIKPYPDSDTKPLVLSCPIPHSQQKASWFFTMSCNNCGYSIFFDAQVISRKIEEKRKSSASDDNIIGGADD